MNYLPKLSASLALCLMLAPFVATAASLVPCNGTPESPCDFPHLIMMVNQVVHFIIFQLAVPVVAVIFVIIGANFILNQNKPAALADARGRMETVGIGFFWIIAAYLIIKLLLYALLNTDQGFTLFLFN